MTARVWPIFRLRSLRVFGASVPIFAALLFSSQLALAQFTQQGPKLVGIDAVPPSEQGESVAVSADGNTAIVGGLEDNNGAGAAWVFTNGGGAWTQQGAKLVGAGAVGPYGAQQGYSVALSADGNTAIVGGYGDDNGTGAAWVFTRSGGVWTQQTKLVGTGAVGGSNQGASVALSGDGNTAIIGGISDNSNIGAAWVFTNGGGAWTQQGAKLVGTGAVGGAEQGFSVSLSADGNTAIVGGLADNNRIGAAWVFTRSDSVWNQQTKLVGTGAEDQSRQGVSVALSNDGNTAIVGGYSDKSNIGAAWVFTRSSGVWTQQGTKLVGAGAVGGAEQGMSVALSADGNTVIVGGNGDNSNIGAAWIFTRSGGVWNQQGAKLVGTDAVGNPTYQGASVALSGDGNTAIIGGPGDNNRIGAVWVFVQPTTVPFSAFSAKLNIYFTPNQYGFALLSNFTLGKTSNGINPVTEAVTLVIGTFTITIPPGSFQEPLPGDWTFVGLINGVTLEAVIRLTAPNQYIFGVTAQKVNLIGTQTPVTVTLTIGNDSGTTQAINF
jgi:FG-GAP repeat